MILTVIGILFVLVLINFLLLFFSCNKTTKRDNDVATLSALETPNPLPATKKLEPTQLSPTGS